MSHFKTIFVRIYHLLVSKTHTIFQDDNDDIDFDPDVIEPARKKRKAAPMV